MRVAYLMARNYVKVKLEFIFNNWLHFRLPVVSSRTVLQNVTQNIRGSTFLERGEILIKLMISRPYVTRHETRLAKRQQIRSRTVAKRSRMHFVHIS